MKSVFRRDAHAFLQSWAGSSSKPSWALWFRLIFLTPGFQLVCLVRLQRWIGKMPMVGPFLRRVVWYWTTLVFACDIDPQAQIGPGLYLPHPTGIVIGGSVKIGSDVAILQHVTLGRGLRNLNQSPVIGNFCEIGCGAVLLGAIVMGDGAKVGANSVVLSDIPAGAIAVGVPARLIARSAT
jgi:serine O-acetyltransferase